MGWIVEVAQRGGANIMQWATALDKLFQNTEYIYIVYVLGEAKNKQYWLKHWPNSYSCILLCGLSKKDHFRKFEW